NEINNYNEILDEYIKEKTSYEESLFLNSKKLHEMRISIANILEDRINKELKYIGMEKSNFKVSILEKDEFFKNGCDKVEFLISTNPGEPLKPLGKIVSGGELSRIMLAIKTAFADKDEIPSIIFDEIDIGISGRVAQSVAEKMYSISKEHQVFCVTHLAQIAVFSDNHFLVEKNVVENETFTKVTKLKKDKKVEEIAKMIGGKSVTKITIDNANEMINMANRVKS
ncbi:MAG: DNA repair protein RecN, partial [Clostridiaceae bacterium]